MKVKSYINWFTIALYILVTIAIFYLLQAYFSMTLNWAFLVFVVTLNIGYKYFNSVEIDNQRLEIKQGLQKQQILLSDLTAVSIKKNSFLKSLFSGLPRENILINYGKFSSLDLFSNNKELFDRLTHSLQLNS